MREIKFRAWSKKHSRYLKVTGIHYDDNKLGGVFVIYGTVAGIPNTICLEPEDVILEQYTGLKDKNGKEIYEGDIIGQFDSNLVCPVKFGYGGFIPFTSDIMTFDNDYCEVIGNIHGNPELLGGEE